MMETKELEADKLETRNDCLHLAEILKPIVTDKHNRLHLAEILRPFPAKKHNGLHLAEILKPIPLKEHSVFLTEMSEPSETDRNPATSSNRTSLTILVHKSLY